MMRFKSILLLIVCICLTTIFYCILISDPKSHALDTINRQLIHLKGVVIGGDGDDRHSDHTIHHSINNIFIINNNHNYHNVNPGHFRDANRADDIDSEESERKCGQYLRVLGLWMNGSDEASVLTTDDQLSRVWPVFVTGVGPEHTDVANGFVRAFQEFSAASRYNYSLIVYDLGLNRRQLRAISSICNESQTQNHTKTSDTTPRTQLNGKQQSPYVPVVDTTAPNIGGQHNNWCQIRRFDYDLFPAHVSDLKLHAYRPLILQLVLSETGAAVWLDPNLYALPTAAAKARNVTARARREGLLSWTIEQPTSSLTHPKMFDYFRTHQNQYYFHRMVKPAHIVLYNTRRVHERLMLPWVKCALTVECLSPIGSQASGCRFDKKPLYRYSGCHHYDTSALNVVLGQMFDFNEKPYAAPEEDKFFRVATVDDQLYTDDDITDSDYVSPAGTGYTYRSSVAGVGSARISRNNSS
ncbi:unnamed protein product [Medioppia subpectinata]|uniref:Uncharacterized protein n=1 Tax=Medioppia subpectinata TaxID=1979941 RepID=A0A7R9KZT1_9ACAR|nr:unnamed protein product [Medioppia subpectinata]CAG2112497.1 unnamed protein product [Medioppia subpectinata]